MIPDDVRLSEVRGEERRVEKFAADTSRHLETVPAVDNV